MICKEKCLSSLAVPVRSDCMAVPSQRATPPRYNWSGALSFLRSELAHELLLVVSVDRERYRLSVVPCSLVEVIDVSEERTPSNSMLDYSSSLERGSLCAFVTSALY